MTLNLYKCYQISTEVQLCGKNICCTIELIMKTGNMLNIKQPDERAENRKRKAINGTQTHWENPTPSVGLQLIPKQTFVLFQQNKCSYSFSFFFALIFNDFNFHIITIPF